MPVYQYHCAQHGLLEVRVPMDSRPATYPCDSCNEPARRVFSAPMLSRLSGPVAAVIDRTERSSDQPDVVTSLPGRPAARPTRISQNPAHRRLPRP